jgi:hypothetical protein
MLHGPDDAHRGKEKNSAREPLHIAACACDFAYNERVSAASRHTRQIRSPATDAVTALLRYSVRDSCPAHVSGTSTLLRFHVNCLYC